MCQASVWQGEKQLQMMAVLEDAHWMRSQGDIRLNSGVPLSWLRGRNPVLLPERFDAKWQQQGVLYTVAGGMGPRLAF